MIIYLILVTAGAVSIYAATYQFDSASMLDFSQFSGKQFIWIGVSLVAGFCIMMLDRRFYDAYAYHVYILIILLLILTIFIAPDIKGSRSWISYGSFSIQPAEFGKFATALALAKLFSGYNFSLNKDYRNYLKACLIILLPAMLIVAQRETGSALAYMSLFLVLYREGMSGFILFAAFCAVTFFVVAIKYTDIVFWGMPLGHAVVLILIMLITVGMLATRCSQPRVARNVAVGYAALSAVAAALSLLGVAVNGTIFLISLIAASLVYLMLYAMRHGNRQVSAVIAFAVAAVAFLYLSNLAFSSLHDYQQQRVRITLGIESDLRGAGYNVNQSKIAIGSGGFAGKGFLAGTQTKLRYVPEQHTDFIFCTVGEEEGFIGSVAVLGLYLALILRLIVLAERQPSAFGRVYGYCTASLLAFHVAVNIGMVIGLCPVIGIPLPFLSYGGSSTLGFTILLAMMLRIDSARRERAN